MNIFTPSHYILQPSSIYQWKDELKRIEEAGRTCYKSEDKITDDSYKKFVGNLVQRGHWAMIEFGSMTVRFICDRGVSHELVRHRLCDFAQESTRYCDYSKHDRGLGVGFVQPAGFVNWTFQQQEQWSQAMRDAEMRYQTMREMGLSPQEARSVLPNSLKTEIVVKANFREWLHIFLLRTAKSAHPDMQALMKPLQEEVARICPEVFGELES